MRTTLALCLLLLLANLAPAEPLADAKLDFAKLKGLPDVVYVLTAYGAIQQGNAPKTYIVRPNGSYNMHTEVDGDKIICKDSILLREPNETGRMEDHRFVLTTTAKASPGLPVVTIQGAAAEGTATITPDGKGKATAAQASLSTPDSKPEVEQIDFHPQTFTISTLLRIIPLLPRNTGHVWTLTTLLLDFDDFEHPYVAKTGEKPFTLTYTGPDKITVGKTTTECTRYALRTSDTAWPSVFWVDKQGQVAQYLTQTGTRATLGDPGPLDTDPMKATLLEWMNPRLAPKPAAPTTRP